MQILITIAAILGLTAVFSYLNERVLHMQQTIGLMLLALAFTLLLMIFNALGIGDGLAREQALVGLGLAGALHLAGLSFGLLFALVFGALISPTDPIAALATLGRVGLPSRLEAVINGESLFNDGVGVVIFSIFLAVALGTRQPTLGDALIMFLREVLGGEALGAVVAAVVHHMLLRSREYGTQLLVSLAGVRSATVWQAGSKCRGRSRWWSPG